LPGRLVSVLELIGVDFALLVIVDVLSHLPDLHDVVFGHGADHPGLIRVPREVGDLGGVASVDKQKFWWSILNVIRGLLLPNLAEIPDIESAISATGRQNGLIMWRPLYLEDLILMRLERVELHLCIPQIPQGNCLVS